MSKYFLFILLILISTFYACPCDELPTCEVTNDCLSEEKNMVCIKGLCSQNQCLAGYEEYYNDGVKNSYDKCGMGECIPGDFGTEENPINYKCECDENTVFYKGKCVPTCSKFTPKCLDFGGHNRNCNIELGHCDEYCQGEGSCEEGYYCDQGSCEISQN